MSYSLLCFFFLRRGDRDRDMAMVRADTAPTRKALSVGELDLGGSGELSQGRGELSPSGGAAGPGHGELSPGGTRQASSAPATGEHCPGGDGELVPGRGRSQPPHPWRAWPRRPVAARVAPTAGELSPGGEHGELLAQQVDRKEERESEERDSGSALLKSRGQITWIRS
ncbi:hypothetical protein C2845_PM09G09700 [Panicum miliaceum]|uniref:Uncharacterized protein n=1 Tax=Panicum miliaceum TaxID=4540 RepID=A0A3L6RZ07_PANMI|nr:hypothetical protein C2845_PM09G09700 [Panicum miliaceum]